MERALQPEEQADRPGGDLAGHRDAGGVGLLQQGELAAPPVAPGLDQRERQRATGLRRHPPEDPELHIDVREVRHDLEHALPGGADGAGDADQLVGLGGQGRRRLALAGAVVERARGREPERPGGHRLGGQRRHRRDVVGGGGLAGGAALAHHVEAQRPMGHLEGDVHVERAPVDRVHELGERAPGPGQALVEDDAGDVLDALHQLDEPLVVLDVDGGEADAAVADDDGRDAVPRRRHHALVPGRLPVVVRVDVDEARGDQQAVGVDRRGGPSR